MKIRNNGSRFESLLSLPANTVPNAISTKSTGALTLYAESLLEEQIFEEIVSLLNKSALSQIKILNKLKQCNLES